MAEEEDLGGIAQSLAALDSVFRQSIDAFSPEEVAWADSCLDTNPGDLDNNLDSLRDALWDVIDDQPQLLSRHFTGASSSQSAGGGTGVPSPNGEAKASELTQLTAEDLAILSGEEIDIDTSLTMEGGYDFRSLLDFRENRSSISLQGTVTEVNEDVHAPSSNYAYSSLINEDSDIVASRAVMDNLSSASIQETIGHKPATEEITSELSRTEEGELSSQDIFKVWDLRIPNEDDEEEDEFATRLEKALAGPPVGSKVKSIDDLIAGIEDLSLSQNST